MKKKELKKINKKLVLALNLLTHKVDDLVADLDKAKRRANDAEGELAKQIERDGRVTLPQHLGEGEG